MITIISITSSMHSCGPIFISVLIKIWFFCVILEIGSMTAPMTQFEIHSYSHKNVNCAKVQSKTVIKTSSHRRHSFSTNTSLLNVWIKERQMGGKHICSMHKLWWQKAWLFFDPYININHQQQQNTICHWFLLQIRQVTYNALKWIMTKDMHCCCHHLQYEANNIKTSCSDAFYCYDKTFCTSFFLSQLPRC